MVHEKFQDLLELYIDGELEPLEALILEDHLADCRSCRRELNQLKLIDWDLKHQPAIETPPELEIYRSVAIKAHLSSVREAEASGRQQEKWHLQQHVRQYAFGFISYNPVNRAVSRSVHKTVSTLTRAAGTRLRKKNPLLSKLIPIRV